MDFTSITIEILKGLAAFAGSYGLAIIVLTVVVRLAMWPLSVSQQRSMRKMQMLSPKLKEIQNRYKSDPQVMQRKMMEFYKEHKFNPFGGCFPLLVQMPIFIMLYTALISPQFIQIAGNTSFLFVNRLDATIKSHAGVVGDHAFGVEKNDNFSSVKTAVVYTDKAGVIKNVEIKDPKKAIQKQGDIVPGEPLDLKINLDQLNLPFSKLSQVKKVDLAVINENTKEVENLTFNRIDSMLVDQVKTEQVKTVIHYDVIALIALFGLTMFLAQKAMSGMQNAAAADPAQKAMQEQMSKIMPIMITSTFIFIPIPAGVLLYMVASNVIQVIQTAVINKQLELEDSEKPKNVETKVPENAKPITANKVNDVQAENTASDENVDSSEKNKKNKKNKW